jgi:AcrR family transcriptional regulator
MHSEHEQHNVRKPVGRPPAASAEQVLRAARDRLGRGERLDVRALAQDLGLGRSTVYAWFGSREGLINAAFAQGTREALPRIRSSVDGQGAEAILETLRRYDRGVMEHRGITKFMEANPAATLRMVTDPDGELYRTHLGLFERLIDDEVRNGSYAPPLPPPLLAEALVVFGQHTLFTGVRSEAALERLDLIRAHLLATEGGGRGRPARVKASRTESALP